MSPTDAWNMTLTEYLNILKCDDNGQNVDLSKVNDEYIQELEKRHATNAAERLKKKDGKG